MLIANVDPAQVGFRRLPRPQTVLFYLIYATKIKAELRISFF